MDRLLQFLLKTFIRRGTFRVTTSRGTVLTFGDGTGQPVSVRFATRAAEWGILLDPELKFGEAYMNGTFVVEQGSIADVLAICSARSPKCRTGRGRKGCCATCTAACSSSIRAGARAATWRIITISTAGSIRCSSTPTGNTAAAISKAPSSRSTTPSSPRSGISPPSCCSAATAAIETCACSTSAAAGAGSGLYLAEVAGADVTGVTLSQEQHAIANERAAEKGLAERARFNLQDYRDVKGPFDRIVSVGMFEHVGVNHYDTFFRKSAQLLADDGVMVLHSIGRSEGPSVDQSVDREIYFPRRLHPVAVGGAAAIEKSGLLVTDIEILRLHYAETLKNWRERFLAHREEVERIYDQRFVRMWEFYLAASEMSFREQNLMVFQIQLTKRQDVVPMTRDYIGREERRLRGAEGERHPPLRLAGE